jgi:hypothetical protein
MGSGGIDFSESIPGLHKRLQIPALDSPACRDVKSHNNKIILNKYTKANILYLN